MDFFHNFHGRVIYIFSIQVLSKKYIQQIFAHGLWLFFLLSKMWLLFFVFLFFIFYIVVENVTFDGLSYWWSIIYQFLNFIFRVLYVSSGLPWAQTVKNSPVMWDTWIQSLGWEDPLEKEQLPHSSILAWRIPRAAEPGRLQSMESQRVRHDWATPKQWRQLFMLYSK